MGDKRYLLLVHVAVVLFGLSGLFAKFITYPAILIVLGRVFFAAVFLFCMTKMVGISLALRTKKDAILFFIIGLLLAIHWSSFFYSIQVSTVAIGLITFATFPAFSVFLEPLLLREPYRRRNLVAAVITFIGVLFIVQDFHFNHAHLTGIVWGIVSALTFAILSILNRLLVKGYSSITVGYYQNSFAFFILLPFIFLLPIKVDIINLVLLLLLGIIFTGVSHVLFIEGLKGVNVQTASVIAVLEPVYGIVAAIFFFGEFPSFHELVGMILILSMAIYVTKGS